MSDQVRRDQRNKLPLTSNISASDQTGSLGIPGNQRLSVDVFQKLFDSAFDVFPALVVLSAK